ncbi:MAG: hypothetical protein JST38_04920 [Bacteroidetes bacterium]|nr:hypothetical protein [Bacteroidota bacterium]
MNPGRKWSFLVALGVLVAGFLSFLGHNGHILGTLQAHTSDPLGYYQFLPGVFIQHDLLGLPYVHILENGFRLSLFNIGVAYMQAPFFLVAHALCLCGLAEPDGYTWPYAVAMGLAAAIYVAFGCGLLMNILGRRFGTGVTAIAVLLLFGCTNLYYYTAMEPGMSHAFSFFLFSVLLWGTVRMQEAPRSRTAILIMMASAFIVLVRPANVIAFAIPLLYGASGPREVWNRLRWPFVNRRTFGIGSLICLLLMAPQFLYWHAVTGKLLVFTYGTKAEGFFWSQPHLWDVLWHPWNGWFLYSPAMVVVMGALLWMAVRGTEGARTILLIWVMAWYLIASWWCWWLGGAFGHRGFVEYMAFLSVPAAWLVQRIRSALLPVRGTAVALGVVLAYFSIVSVRPATSCEV